MKISAHEIKFKIDFILLNNKISIYKFLKRSLKYLL